MKTRCLKQHCAIQMAEYGNMLPNDITIMALYKLMKKYKNRQLEHVANHYI